MQVLSAQARRGGGPLPAAAEDQAQADVVVGTFTGAEQADLVQAQPLLREPTLTARADPVPLRRGHRTAGCPTDWPPEQAMPGRQEQYQSGCVPTDLAQERQVNQTRELHPVLVEKLPIREYVVHPDRRGPPADHLQRRHWDAHGNPANACQRRAATGAE